MYLVRHLAALFVIQLVKPIGHWMFAVGLQFTVLAVIFLWWWVIFLWTFKYLELSKSKFG